MQRALCRNIDKIGIVGMHHHVGDVAGLFQAHVFPGFPGIGGFVYAIAVGGHDAAYRVLAHAHVNDIGIGIGNRNIAYRAGFKLAIGDVAPVEASVFGFPQTTSRIPAIVQVFILDDA